MVHSVRVIDIPRRSLRERGPEVITHLKKGNIIIVRGAPEIWALKDMLVSSMRMRGGDTQADEVSNWCEEGQSPSALTLAHFSNLLLDMKRAFIMPALLADFVREIGFAEPLSVESGAPRFNVPKEVEEEFLGHDDIVDPAVFGKAGDDPTFHHMWVGGYYPHRDVGRPHLGFNPNAWCALQDLDDRSCLIFFPDAYQDPSCDTDYYKFSDGPDPARWGFGEPLKVPANFGDIILFDADHLHSSPRTSGDYSRLSWEIRIMERCFDDVGWYRLGYLNHRNYQPTFPR